MAKASNLAINDASLSFMKIYTKYKKPAKINGSSKLSIDQKNITLLLLGSIHTIRSKYDHKENIIAIKNKAAPEILFLLFTKTNIPINKNTILTG
ncbi:hypothetical protein KJ761_00260 [Patescibacteria group bacterium]|nr:hypothetical protein [Patescibacteria group bacterium]